MTTGRALDRRRWTDVLMHRWPTALGIAVAALAAFDLQDSLEFAALTVLMALIYLGAAALDRRWSGWLVLLAGLPLAMFIPSISGVHPVVVLLVAAPVFLVLGVARGQRQASLRGHGRDEGHEAREHEAGRPGRHPHPHLQAGGKGSGRTDGVAT